MLRTAELSAQFAFADRVVARFSDTLEVSLDCCICHRCYRTVIFHVGGVEGRCTPTGHAFPGKLVEKDAGPASVSYRLEYWYEPFQDAKYRDSREPTGQPTWGRIGFEVICPNCGETRRCSTQTNMVRPWSCFCGCGHQLYTDSALLPLLRPAEFG